MFIHALRFGDGLGHCSNIESKREMAASALKRALRLAIVHGIDAVGVIDLTFLGLGYRGSGFLQ